MSTYKYHYCNRCSSKFFGGIENEIPCPYCEIARLKAALEEKEKRFVEGFEAGKRSVLRKNQSGCCCEISDSDEIVSVCMAHKVWREDALADRVGEGRRRANNEV